MTLHRPALLICLLLSAAAFRTATAPARYGPYHGRFIPNGVGLRRETSVGVER